MAEETYKAQDAATGQEDSQRIDFNSINFRGTDLARS